MVDISDAEPAVWQSQSTERTPCPKNSSTIFLPLRQTLSDFQNGFTDRLSSKFPASDNIPPQRVAKLPCEILMLKKEKQPETCIMINDTAQRCVAMRFRSGETLDYYFIMVALWNRADHYIFIL